MNYVVTMLIRYYGSASAALDEHLAYRGTGEGRKELRNPDFARRYAQIQSLLEQAALRDRQRSVA